MSPGTGRNPEEQRYWDTLGKQLYKLEREEKDQTLRYEQQWGTVRTDFTS
jgi:hypothetical protein